MSIRRANDADLVAIKMLESVAFPKNRIDLEPAVEGELERGIERGELWVSEENGRICAFIQFEKINKDLYSLIAIAVDPKVQGEHVGKRLIKKMLKRVENRNIDAEVNCVTSPTNLKMVSLLLGLGFKATELISDYFGPKKDRLWFRLSRLEPDYPILEQVKVPLEHPEAFVRLMTEKSFHIIGNSKSSQGSMLTLGIPIIADPVSLRQTEANTSVGQASGILAALAFILGFVYSSGNHGIFTPLGVFLVISIVMTAGAVQLYANSTGNMARIGDGNFDKHMKWGNLLLDFGGHYPLVLVLPALVVSGHNHLMALIAGAAVSGLLFLYEFSSFSIFKRYKQTALGYVLVSLTSLVPIVSAVLAMFWGGRRLELWLVGVFALLFARFALQARAKNVEKRQAKSKFKW